MGIKINQYAIDRTVFGDDDYYDIDYWTGSSYETAKIKGSVIKAAILAAVVSENLFTTNNLTLPANRQHYLTDKEFKFDINDSSNNIIGNSRFGSAGIVGFLNDTSANVVTSYNINGTDIIFIADGPSNYTSLQIATGSISLNEGGTDMSIDGLNAIVSSGNGTLQIGSVGTSNTWYTDNSTNKYGILLIGFGETSETNGTGANYTTLVDTSLVPKKYVDDEIAGITSTSLYSDNGTIGSGRVATITDSLEFAGGQLNLSTTTDGFLMPRLTTAEMNAISSPDTHLLIFNTDLNGLYRYNGTDWVAMSAGYGVIEVMKDGASGNPVFYADFQSALDQCQTGTNTVKLHDNIVLTSQATIAAATFNYDNLTIDFNGFTLSNAQANGDAVIYIQPSANNRTVLRGGQIKRTNGVSAFAIGTSGSGTREIVFDSMYVYCDNYMTAWLGGQITLDLGGTVFESDTGSETVRFGYGEFRNFTGINNGTGYAVRIVSNAIISNFQAINTSTGNAFLNGGYASNFVAISESGYAVAGGRSYNFKATSTSGVAVQDPVWAENFVARTGNNRAIFVGVNSISNFQAYNNSATETVYFQNTLYASNGFAFNDGTGNALKFFVNQNARNFSYSHLTGISDGGVGGYCNSSIKTVITHSEFVSKLDTTDGHAFECANGDNDLKLMNCTFRVANNGAEGLYASSARIIGLANSSFENMTTAINSNITINNTGTTDAYGNILI